MDDEEFRTIICCGCAIPFQMSSNLYRLRKNDHAAFYCPNGHQQQFTGKSEGEKAKEESAKHLEEATKQKERADKNWNLYTETAAKLEKAEREIRRLRGESPTLAQQVIDSVLGRKQDPETPKGM